MTTADRVMTFKHVVKTYATKHGLHATFMPKPVYGIAGSGMHTNMSLMTTDKNGNKANAFSDPSSPNGLSRVAHNFIAGILKHVRGIAAYSNPTVNSYKRLVPGYEAPTYVVWSSSNRSSLVRIPVARGMGTRVELRNPDPAVTLILKWRCALPQDLTELKNDLTPLPSVDYNVFDLTEEEVREKGIPCLPTSLEEAVIASKEDPFIKETVGDHVFAAYTEGKMHEWEEYKSRVS